MKPMTVIISEIEKLVTELKCRAYPEQTEVEKRYVADMKRYTMEDQEHQIQKIIDRLEALENIQSLLSDAQNEACKSNAIDRSGGQVAISPPQEKAKINFETIPQDKDRGIFRVRAYQTDKEFGYDRWVADQYSLGKGTHEALLIVFKHDEKGTKLP